MRIRNNKTTLKKKHKKKAFVKYERFFNHYFPAMPDKFTVARLQSRYKLKHWYKCTRIYLNSKKRQTANLKNLKTL